MPGEEEGSLPSSGWRPIYINALVAIAGIVGGVIAAISSSESVLSHYHVLISAILILLIATVGTAVFGDVAIQARNASVEMERIGSHLRGKIPRLVTFVSRKENIFVTESGDGVFESIHTVRYNENDENDITQLHFPITIDLANENVVPGSKVEVESVTVDGISQTSPQSYEAQEVRKPVNGRAKGVCQEHGVIKVAVELNKFRRTADIYIKVKYKEIFKDSQIGDYVIVDIPYVTESLSVTISPENKKKTVRRVIGDDVTIAAICEMMDMRDKIEESKQSPRFRQLPQALQWDASDAKIGYRYKLWFRLVDRDSQGSNVA